MDGSRWLFFVAGTNGAGKSTFADQYLSGTIADLPFVNVDDNGNKSPIPRSGNEAH